MRLLVIILFLFSLPTLAQTINWDAPVVVNSEINMGNTRPKIALTKDNIPIVMWGRAPNREVYVSKWTGNNFSTPVKVTPQGVNAFVQNWAGPGLEAQEDTVYVTFKSQPEQDGFVYVVRSIDGGKTFGDTLRVSSNNWSRFPEVSILPGGNPVVTYMDFEPGFIEPHYAVCTSDNGGVTFSEPISASGIAPGEACDCCPGFILAERDQIVVMFRNNDNDLRDIWASVSKDGGRTFPLGKDIDRNDWIIGGCPSTGPEAITIGDSLVAVWMSGASGKSKINIGTADLKALNVGINSEITPETNNQQNYPKIDGDGQFIITTWQEIENGSRNIKCSWSDRGPSALISKVPFDVNVNKKGVQQSPDISYSNGVVHIVWQDLTARKVMYRRGEINVSSINKPTLANLDFDLYPNPSNNICTVKLDPIINEKGTIEIRTSVGQLMSIHEIIPGTSLVINTSNGFNPGVYLVVLDVKGLRTYKTLAVE
ncbi:MAG: T9SS type A sorting domain-containing protein [Bacteroidia bacterium]|nr:T9SS type A sorting domain-containing protein [Bacteroidia bacterium]